MERSEGGILNAPHSVFSLIIIFVFAASLYVSCTGGGGDNEDTDSLKANGLVGSWDCSDFHTDIDEFYITFNSDDSFEIEASTYFDRNGNIVDSQIFIYGTYTTTADSITFLPDYAADENKNQIPDADIDNCWIYSSFYSSVKFNKVEIQTGQLILNSGGTIVREPSTSPTCPDDFTITSKSVWGTKIGEASTTSSTAFVINGEFCGGSVSVNNENVCAYRDYSSGELEDIEIRSAYNGYRIGLTIESPLMLAPNTTYDIETDNFYIEFDGRIVGDCIGIDEILAISGTVTINNYNTDRISGSCDIILQNGDSIECLFDSYFCE